MYFIDLCKGKPTVTENARCIKARYDNGISNFSADKSGVLCLSADCSERTNEIFPIKFQRGNPKINEKGISNCISAGYNKSGVNNRGEATGVFYGCRAVLTPDREKKRQNGRRFKECGEPAFCLTAQDKHGVYLCSCSDCEHAMPIKNATQKGYAEAKCGDAINLAFPDSKTGAELAKVVHRHLIPLVIKGLRYRDVAEYGNSHRENVSDCKDFQTKCSIKLPL